MKKILLIAAIALIGSCTAIAQNIPAAFPLVGGTYGGVTDTVVNTASIVKFIKVTQSYDAMSIQAVITKISGTVAGTVTPVGSNDGVNFVDISRASVAATTLRTAYKDTLIPTNVTTNTKVWVFSKAAETSGNTPEFGPYLYYGLKYTGAGTMSAKFKAYLVPRKQ